MDHTKSKHYKNLHKNTGRNKIIYLSLPSAYRLIRPVRVSSIIVLTRYPHGAPGPMFIRVTFIIDHFVILIYKSYV